MSTPVPSPAWIKHSGHKLCGALAGSGFLQPEQIFTESIFTASITVHPFHYGLDGKGNRRSD
jgi:hypothetical protein